MRAVRISGPGDVAVVDADDPVPGRGEVVVEVATASVCSTDRKLLARGPAEPRIIGHEATGRLADGTLVGIHPEIVCQDCEQCAAGWHNRCPHRLSMGLGRDGALADRVAVPEQQLVPLGDLDAVTGAILEPLACVVHAVDEAHITERAPSVVVGAGVMGILTAWLLQSYGCPVVLSQRSARRRELAGSLGIEVMAPDDDPAGPLGTAATAVFVTAPGAEPLQWALETVAVGGLVHAFAGTPGGALVDANLVHYRHLRLVGSTGSRLQDYIKARDLVAGGEIELGRMPYRVVGLDGVPDALSADPSDRYLKTVVAIGPGEQDAIGSGTTEGNQP